MKKIPILFIAVALLAVGGLAAIITPLALNYSRVQYSREMNMRLLSLAETDMVTGEYGGVEVAISAKNLEAAMTALNRGSLHACVFAPSSGEKETAVITFPDGAVYTVFETESGTGGDTAYILYSHNGRTSRFRIDGMATMAHLASYLAPNGYYGENEVLD